MTEKITPKLLRILFGGKVGYEALLEEHDNKIYYRTLGDDKYGCQAMLDELIHGEYIEVFDSEDIQNITLDDGTVCSRSSTDYRQIQTSSIDTLTEYFNNKGLRYELVEDTNTAFSITFQGHELLPGVASQSDVNRISSLTTSIFKASNNRNYEPRQEELASSYKINVFDNKFEADGMITLLNELKAGIISADRYFSDDNYKKLLKDIENLSYIKSLKGISINIGILFESKLSMSEIHKIRSLIADMFNQKPFNADVDIDQTRAFDEKNISFKIDYDGRTYSAHTNQTIFDKIYKVKHERKHIRFQGVYAGDRTVEIRSAVFI
ncbi:MAG: hypothetical protein PHX13_11620 [Thiovulaceae bacterium]|nr:hypothetical protein [Sulfurimonadaceae bacterium]